MMENLTPRFGLPQLAVAQAHKEITHNEALALIDGLLHPAIEGILSTPPAAAAADAGKCWLIGPAASGAFAGKGDQIAYWTGGSWRFVAPKDGLRLWHRVEMYPICYIDQQWQAPLAIAPPSGGATVDLEARTVLTALINSLAQNGILPPA